MYDSRRSQEPSRIALVLLCAVAIALIGVRPAIARKNKKQDPGIESAQKLEKRELTDEQFAELIAGYRQEVTADLGRLGESVLALRFTVAGW